MQHLTAGPLCASKCDPNQHIPDSLLSGQPRLDKIVLPYGKEEDMPSQSTVEIRVRRQVDSFLRRSGIRGVEIRPTTDLIKDAGFTSLQGVEFVLDLCEEFDF